MKGCCGTKPEGSWAEWCRRYDGELKIFFVCTILLILFSLFLIRMQYTQGQDYRPIQVNVGWSFAAIAFLGLSIAVFKKSPLSISIALVAVYFDYGVLVANVPENINTWQIYYAVGLLASMVALFIAIFPKRKVY